MEWEDLKRLSLFLVVEGYYMDVIGEDIALINEEDPNDVHRLKDEGELLDFIYSE